MLTLHNAHFAEFARLAEPDLGWAGQIPARWVVALREHAVGRLPDEHLDRKALKAFCADAANSDEACFVACMAWGGMNREHGRKAWEAREKWRARVELLRRGGVSREKAYHTFSGLNIPGLGPAYFTKLIFFLRPEDDGYILDQWTGKSISLLFADRFISILGTGWVDRSNRADVYERYCGAVDHLAEKLGRSGDVVEEMMFSRGGRRRHAWRDYVVANWTVLGGTRKSLPAADTAPPSPAH